MEFDLQEDHRLIRDMARDFAANELAPRATRHDREEQLDPDLFGMMGELGLFGLSIPEQYGGFDAGSLGLALVLEELNHACASTGVTVSVHASLVCTPMVKFGTDEQKAHWLPKLATGEVIGAYSLTEAGAGSDAAALSSTAVRDGDEWVLNGTKLFVTTGEQAGLVIGYFRTDPEAPKARGISAFLVDAKTPGYKVGKKEKKTGLRGSSTTELIFENCRVPAGALLGELHRGFPIAMDTLDGGRIGIAAQALGIGRACLEASVSYAQEREQFGKPIGRFQAVQWKLADMATRLDAARLLTQRAAWLRDQGKPCGMQAAQAKLAASTTANFCADECLQIHGGAGYTDEFHVERLFRDARITEIYEGATDIQRLVIARQLLK
jgi:alkylation response protein AidB-like acyl-CoA dehydrogenase